MEDEVVDAAAGGVLWRKAERMAREAARDDVFDPIPEGKTMEEFLDSYIWSLRREGWLPSLRSLAKSLQHKDLRA